jgi:suppressor for copper-sensitivity B
MSFLLTLLSGILGGVILNIMPCVIPALFAKAYHVVKLRNQENSAEKLAQKKKNEFFFLLGILVTFSTLAIFIISLKASGKALGWGMQMQNPIFVGALTVLTYLFAISNFELVDLNLGITQKGSKGKSEQIKAFLDGIFITLISTPCSAPILGTATTYALSKDSAWWETLLLFWSIGLGLALPSLAFTLITPIANLIPKPGKWADYFKTLVGYSLIAATVWLFSVLVSLINQSQLILMLYMMTVLTAFLHLRKQASEPLKDTNGLDLYDDQSNQPVTPLSKNPGKKWAFYLTFSALILWIAHTIQLESLNTQITVKDTIKTSASHLKWVAFSEEKIKTYLAQKRPVFVDFTADWCVSCKAFEKAHLNTPEMIALFETTQFVAMQADLTKEDDALWEFLGKYNRSGIPAYFLFSPDGTVDLLPEGPPLNLADKMKALSEKYPVSGFLEAPAMSDQKK